MEKVKVAKVSDRLRQAMQAANKIQADLVRETGIDRSAISNYLYGRYEPKEKNFAKLAKALNCNEWWLMGYDVPMERHYAVNKDDAEFLDSLPPLQPKQELPAELEAINTLIASAGYRIEKANNRYYMAECGELSNYEVNALINATRFSVRNMVELMIQEKTNELRNYLSKGI